MYLERKLSIDEDKGRLENHNNIFNEKDLLASLVGINLIIGSDYLNYDHALLRIGTMAAGYSLIGYGFYKSVKILKNNR